MDAEINQLIAKRVEERRTRLGMTLSELALASGLPASTLERLERQYRGCSAADLWRVARVLDVSITDLCPPPPAERQAAAADEQDPPARSWRDKRRAGPYKRAPRRRMS